ncbi:MAG: methyltransferase domain-containing protein [Ktedonobacterales bacterium]
MGETTGGSSLPAEVREHYASGYEAQRVTRGDVGGAEMLRTQELVLRYLPPPPAIVLDIGGGPGVYATWLARLGYTVHLIDALPLHVEFAQRASDQQPDAPLASVVLGDARSLAFADACADAVLLFGPLYHLTERDDRIQALREACRVLRPGGIALAVGISRYATTLEGIFRGFFDDPAFVAITERDVLDGQHRNPTDHPDYFTTTYFYHPSELRVEMEAAGLYHEVTLAVEGPAWLAQQVEERWEDAAFRERILAAVRRVEREPSLLGVSAHLLAVGRRNPGER